MLRGWAETALSASPKAKRASKRQQHLRDEESERRPIMRRQQEVLNRLVQEVKTPARRRSADVDVLRKLVRKQTSSELAYEEVWENRFAPS